MTPGRRLLAPALALLMPILGISTLLLPAVAMVQDLCPAPSTAGCCPEESRVPCQSPDRAPWHNTCRTCDGTVQLAPASRQTELKAPSGAFATVGRRETSPVHCQAAAHLRLVALAASPPARILLSTFRN